MKLGSGCLTMFSPHLIQEPFLKWWLAAADLIDLFIFVWQFIPRPLFVLVLQCACSSAHMRGLSGLRFPRLKGKRLFLPIPLLCGTGRDQGFGRLSMGTSII